MTKSLSINGWFGQSEGILRFRAGGELEKNLPIHHSTPLHHGVPIHHWLSSNKMEGELLIQSLAGGCMTLSCWVVTPENRLRTYLILTLTDEGDISDIFLIKISQLWQQKNQKKTSQSICASDPPNHSFTWVPTPRSTLSRSQVRLGDVWIFFLAFFVRLYESNYIFFNIRSKQVCLYIYICI